MRTPFSKRVVIPRCPPKWTAYGGMRKEFGKDFIHMLGRMGSSWLELGPIAEDAGSRFSLVMELRKKSFFMRHLKTHK